MDRAILEDCVKFIEERGVEIVGYLDVPCGGGSVWPGDDIWLFATDKVGYAAKTLRVSREEYLTWVEQDGTPRCGAKTRRGRRCKNPITGYSQVKDIHEFLSMDGGYCYTHGGD